jgi:hypothetical protein
MVPSLSPRNLVSVEIGKDFMRSHGHIKHAFEVRKWAAPEFLEQAARELVEAEWKRKAQEMLPEGTTPRRGSHHPSDGPPAPSAAPTRRERPPGSRLARATARSGRPT